MPKVTRGPGPNGIYRPAGWDKAWIAARATAGTSQVGVMVIGDSIAQGAKATDWYSQGWAGLVRTQLAARYSPGGVLAAEYVQAADNVINATAALPAGSVQLINRSTRTYTLTLTSVAPAPVFTRTITVAPGTNQTINLTAGQLTLVATAPGDDGQSGVTWPPTLTVSAGTV